MHACLLLFWSVSFYFYFQMCINLRFFYLLFVSLLLPFSFLLLFSSCHLSSLFSVFFLLYFSFSFFFVIFLVFFVSICWFPSSLIFLLFSYTINRNVSIDNAGLVIGSFKYTNDLAGVVSMDCPTGYSYGKLALVSTKPINSSSWVNFNVANPSKNFLLSLGLNISSGSNTMGLISVNNNFRGNVHFQSLLNMKAYMNGRVVVTSPSQWWVKTNVCCGLFYRYWSYLLFIYI